MGRNAGLDTLASLLKVDKGRDGRYRIRLSDEARKDSYVSNRIVIGGVPKADGKMKGGDEEE